MSSSSRVWEEIVTAALVGTERQALPAPAAGTALGDLLTRLDGTDPERALLGAVAAAGLYRRAGWLPAVDGRPAPEPCGPEVMPRCPPRAARRLAQMLAGEGAEFLTEWLQTAARQGVRVPEAALPDLLDAARTRPEMGDLLAPVAGVRGRWLAALNPEWGFLAPAEREEEAIWETGSRAERLAVLRRLRATEPDRARALVTSTWTADPPEDRARFVSSFEAGLSMADEPFLESALDDRRKEVRQAAAELLARLPESRLCRRMVERLLPLLAIRRGARGEVVEVQLPEACDKATVRDGVEPRLRLDHIGEKGGWVVQMLAAVPPATWSARWERAPAALIAAARGDWQFALLGGWSQAAQRHRDTEWAEALLRTWLNLGGAQPFRDLWWGLFAALPVERQEGLIRELLNEERKRMRPEHADLLRECRHGWSPDLTRAVMDRLQRHIASGGGLYDGNVLELMKEAVHRIPPALGLEVAAGWTAAESWGAWDESVGEFLARLQFRHEMLREIE